MSNLTITVNDEQRAVSADPDTPLLYVLRNELGLTAAKFGCGLAQCGVCSVLMDMREIRACVTPVSAAQGKSIVTLEGLPALWSKTNGSESGRAHHRGCIRSSRPGSIYRCRSAATVRAA